MSPEKTPPNQSDSILPEEPYFKHYEQLNKPKEIQTEVKQDETEKTDAKKGFANIKALAMGATATALIAAGVTGSNYLADKNEQESRFNGKYTPTEQQEPFLSATNSPTIEQSSTIENPK